MPNKNYINGRAKEYRICKALKKRGYAISQRSAGSHSPIDVFAIDKKRKKIKFVQAKPESMSWTAKEKLEEEHQELNEPGWSVSFEVI